MINKQKLIVIGGGAAGFFGAVRAVENKPSLEVIILEQGSEVLGKVKISGGGRCNVTHACYDVRELVKFYPRGSRELTGPFSRFSCPETIDWFENRGVELKTEEDGRIFPVTDNSQTIIDCLNGAAADLGIDIRRREKVMKISVENGFIIHTNDREYKCDKLLVTSGSNPTIWEQLKKLGHSVVAPVPSLFTFNIKSSLIKGLEGVSLPWCRVKIANTKFEAEGPVLITHWGLSGPGILKLSAFAAVELSAMQYRFQVQINWVDTSTEEVKRELSMDKEEHSKKNISNYAPFSIPNRFWKNLLAYTSIPETKKYADLSKEEISKLATELTSCQLEVNGKSTNKDEFVTAGGVLLKEVNFKTMESKLVPGLFFAGEVLDIDGITGGFNFQSAWTTGYLAGSSIGTSM